MPYTHPGRPGEQALTPKQLCEQLGVTIATLHNWRKLGQGPAFYRINRLIQYYDKDVAEWLETKRVSANGKSG